LSLQVQRTLQQVAQAHEQVRRLLSVEHDYAQALRVLADLPEDLRDAALYEEALKRTEKVAQLDQAIQEAVRSKRLAGLSSQVSALLELQPQRADLRRLLDVLPKEAKLPPVIINAIDMKLTLLSAETFDMGSPPTEAERSSNESPQHLVAIKKPFYLSIYPVTQRQYEAVMGRKPAFFNVRNGGSPDHPVEQVTWDDACEFCRRLSALAVEKDAGHVYRLPMEAEWEYACRAGTTTAFAFGPSLSSNQANFNGNYPYGGALRGPYLQATSKVGSYPANAFGLHDMHGNVWEWCHDYFDDAYYAMSPKEDPPGPAKGQYRVLRGGSWYTSGRSCRSAARNMSTPDVRSNFVGFRVVLAPGGKMLSG